MDIQTQDGILLRNIPDGTPDDVIKARIAQIRGGNKPDMPDVPSVGNTLAIGAGRGLDKLAMGLKQGVYGVGAVLSEVLPKGMRDKAQGAITQELVNTEAQQKGMDEAYAPLQRARPFATAIGEALPMMASPMLRAASGAGMGATALNAGVSAALPQLANYGTAEERLKNAGMAAATGGAAGLGMGAIAKAVNPSVSPQVKMLQAAGITPTPGQILGGPAARFEEKLASAPIVGDAISAARGRVNEEFNKAVINRGLGKIGESVDEIGREGVSAAAKKISDKYEQLLPMLKVRVDQQFADEMRNLAGMAQNLPKPQADQFNSIMGSNIANRFSPNGGMAGKTMKEAESQLGYYVRKYGSSPDPDHRMLADSLREAQSSLRDLVMRSNPTHAEQLQNINSAFAQQVRVEGAAGRLGSREGVFTPEGFAGAVKAADKSSRKNQFAKGNALMQDLADAGLGVLGRNVPDSGTATRLMNIAALGSAAVHPGPLLGMGAGAALYSPPAQKAIAALLTKRPELAGLLGQQINNYAPQVGMAGGLLGAAYE